eukprot:gi/632991877/ref/XP_007884825.1/ PREDICTED: growth arrest and DNA damage-inducible proteins-interacting protein 1 [Callorhinchus milii]
MAAPMCWRRIAALGVGCQGLGAAPRGLPVARWLPAARYHPRPLRLDLSGRYNPSPGDPDTPDWRRGPRAEARSYGRLGAASGVDPDRLWPDPDRLQRLVSQQRLWEPGLRDTQRLLAAREGESERRERER